MKKLLKQGILHHARQSYLQKKVMSEECINLNIAHQNLGLQGFPRSGGTLTQIGDDRYPVAGCAASPHSLFGLESCRTRGAGGKPGGGQS